MIARAALVVCVAVASPALAHDHWLEVTRTATGTTVYHHVGAGLVSELSRPWEPQKAARAELIGPTGVVTDLRVEHPSPSAGPPALSLGALPAGTHLLLLDRSPVDITLDGPEFRDYLHEEGIDAALARQGIAVDFTRPGRERYARYLKAIIEGGDAKMLRASRGQRLEITPLGAIPAAGHRLELRVTFDGKPLGGAVVFAEHRDAQGLIRERGETARDGTLTVSLARPDRWLVRLVHMRRCAQDCASADWESFWGALTFDVPSKRAKPER